MTPTIAAERVTKRFGPVVALDGVSLTVAPGECVGLVGHNGAGKTTLFKLLLGLARPEGGKLCVLGSDPAGAHGARSRGAIGFLPENVAFDGAATGEETLTFYARLKGVADADVRRLLARVELSAAAGRRIGTYSRGMRQRLGLAQALIGTPRLLLLDEPTTGLDPQLRAGFYELIEDAKRAGAAILLSSHVLSELEGRVDRLLVLNRGRLIAGGTLHEIRRRTRLPTSLRVVVSPCRTAEIGMMVRDAARCRVLDDRTVIATCIEEDKMALLRTLAASALVEDVETIPPSLEELYGHLLRDDRSRAERGDGPGGSEEPGSEEPR